MLTFSAIKTDAFIDEDCEPMCERCAAEKYGALFIAKLEAGLVDEDNSVGVRAVSGYEMGERESEEAYRTAEYYAEEEGYATTRNGAPFVYTDREEIVEAMEEDGVDKIVCSGTCGRVYTGGEIPWQERKPDGSVPEYVRSADDNRWTM